METSSITRSGLPVALLVLAGCGLVVSPPVVPPVPVTPVPPAAVRAVGVTGYDGVPHAYATARGVGIGWVRVQFRWVKIEAQPGVYNWDMPYGEDRVSARQRIDAATAHGFGILVQVDGTPAWTASHGQPENPPSDPAHFRNFMAAAVREFGDRVQSWILWNEPNWCGATCYWSGTPAQYRRLILAPGFDGVKSVMPSAVVVAPNTLHKSGELDIGRWIAVDGTFVRPVDVVGVHAYGTRAQQVGWVDRFAAWCRARRQCSGIWLTEFGFSQTAALGPDPAPGDAVVAVLKRCRSYRLCQLAFIFRLYDDPTEDMDFGLLTSTGVPKSRLTTLREWLLPL